MARNMMSHARCLMGTHYVDLTTLTFEGVDFADHGLELGILPDLAAYKQLVVETAKALWKAKHPERERLPKGFEEGIRLKFFSIQAGSTAIPIKREVSTDAREPQQELFEDDSIIVDEAAALIEEAVDAASKEQLLPEHFPRNVIRLFDDFGRNLHAGSSIRMRSARRTQDATYNPETRTRLITWTDAFYEDKVSASGEVRQADLDGFNFTLRLDDGSKVFGKFESQQEEDVTDALRAHKSRRLCVSGIGRFVAATGRLERFTRVDSLLVETPLNTLDPSTVPVWQEIMEIGATIPEEEWEKLPKDLSENLDRYLYHKE